LFRGRHFEDVVIVLCVRWYLRYSLSYRDLEEMMAERGLSIDHLTVWRWVLRYAPVLNQRIRGELRRPNGSWRVDETYVKVAGKETPTPLLGAAGDQEENRQALSQWGYITDTLHSILPGGIVYAVGGPHDRQGIEARLL